MGLAFIFCCSFLVRPSSSAVRSLYTAGATCIADECCGLAAASTTLLAIGGDVVTIPDGAFQDCVNIVEIDFSLARSLTHISANAFEGCDGIVALNFSGAIALTSIGDEAFARCAGIVTLDLSGAALVENIGVRAFAINDALMHATLPRSLTHVGQNAFNESFVDYMVEGTLIVHDAASVAWNGVVCTELALDPGTFPFPCPPQICTESNTIDTCVDDLTEKKQSVPTMCRAGSASTVVIDSDESSIFPQRFEYCANLVTVIFRNAANLVLIKRSAFAHTSLETVDMRDATALSQIDAGAFFNITTLKLVLLPPNILILDSNAFSQTAVLSPAQVYWNGAECTSIVTRAVRQGGASAFDFDCPLQDCSVDTTLDTCILRSAITDCSSVPGAQCCSGNASTVVVASTVQIIPPSAFDGCHLISRIRFANIEVPADGSTDTWSCAEMQLREIGQRAFAGAHSLTSLSLAALHSIEFCDDIFPSQLASIGDFAFFNCTQLVDLTLAESLEYVGAGSFLNTKLNGASTVVFNGFDCKHVQAQSCLDIGNPCAFTFECPDLSCIEASSASVDTCIATGEELASDGSGCTLGVATRTIVISESVVALTPNAFAGCVAVTRIVFRRAKSLAVIGNGTFGGMSAVATVDLRPATQLRIIGNDAFGEAKVEVCVAGNGCSDERYSMDALRRFIFAPGILRIGKRAFTGAAPGFTPGGVPDFPVFLFNGVDCRGVAQLFKHGDPSFDARWKSQNCPRQGCFRNNTDDTCVLRHDHDPCTSHLHHCCAGAATSVTIDRALTAVPPAFFGNSGCPQIAKIHFQHAEALEMIGARAFSGAGIERVDLSGATALATVAPSAFASSAALAEVVLSGAIETLGR